MEEFKKLYNEFNYFYRGTIKAGKTITCKLPVPTGKARSIKSITWSTGNMVQVTATISAELDGLLNIWEDIKPGAVLSPATTAMKFKNTATGNGQVFVRVIME